MIRTCATCRYARLRKLATACHRNAPTALVVESTEKPYVAAWWPQVATTDFCGEHEDNRLLAGWSEADIADPFPSEET